MFADYSRLLFVSVFYQAMSRDLGSGIGSYDCMSVLSVPEGQAGRLRYGMSVVGGKRSGGWRPLVAQASRLHLAALQPPPVTLQKVWPALRFGAFGVTLSPP